MIKWKKFSSFGVCARAYCLCLLINTTARKEIIQPSIQFLHFTYTSVVIKIHDSQSVWIFPCVVVAAVAANESSHSHVSRLETKEADKKSEKGRKEKERDRHTLHFAFATYEYFACGYSHVRFVSSVALPRRLGQRMPSTELCFNMTSANTLSCIYATQRTQ